MSTVFHVHGFVGERGVTEVKVSQQEGRVIDVARGTIERATSSKHTELVRFNRTWPIDGYGQEWAVVQVDAVTKTRVNPDDSWTEIWHWFGTASSPWPLAQPEVAGG